MKKILFYFTLIQIGLSACKKIELNDCIGLIIEKFKTDARRKDYPFSISYFKHDDIVYYDFNDDFGVTIVNSINCDTVFRCGHNMDCFVPPWIVDKEYKPYWIE